MNAIKILKNIIMKKIKLFAISMIGMMVLITSCEDNEVIYDPLTGQDFAFFTITSSSLAVLIDESSVIEVELGVSTLSSSARTIALSIDPSSTADAQNYDIPTSVTIPANEYVTNLTVTGIDNTVETAAETIIIKMETVDGAAIAQNATHTISLFQVCPVAETAFTGNYLIEQTSAYVDGPTLEDGNVVQVINEGGTARSFQSSRYVWYCGTQMAFDFTLVCNDVIVPLQNTNCACDDFTDFFGPAAVPSTYDPNDDSVFFLTFADDVKGDCGPTQQTTYKFTKQ